MVVLRLARVAQYERGAQGRVRIAGSDAFDAGKEAFAIAPAAHAAQVRARHVLQRKVEVRAAGFPHYLDQTIAELRWIQIQQAGAGHPFGYRLHQGLDRRAMTETPAPPVPAVGRQVLSDQDDLLHLESVDLGQDVGRLARPLAAPERRDSAESTLAVAPLGHLDVRPGCLGRRPGQVEQVKRRDRRSVRPALGGEGDRHPEPGHQVDLWQGVSELFAVALGHAAGDDQASSRPPDVGQGQDGVDRLLAGRFDEGASVDDDQVGLLRPGSPVVTVSLQGPGQLVGVHLVLRASERLQPVPHPEQPTYE